MYPIYRKIIQNRCGIAFRPDGLQRVCAEMPPRRPPDDVRLAAGREVQQGESERGTVVPPPPGFLNLVCECCVTFGRCVVVLPGF